MKSISLVLAALVVAVTMVSSCSLMVEEEEIRQRYPDRHLVIFRDAGPDTVLIRFNKYHWDYYRKTGRMFQKFNTADAVDGTTVNWPMYVSVKLLSAKATRP